MMKKGISPLIATVLLIGFTIALAALVMIWGQEMFQETTEQTGEQASGQIKCLQEVDIDIASVKNTGSSPIGAMTDNKGTAVIYNAIVRIYFDDGTVEVLNGDLSGNLIQGSSIAAYGRANISTTYTGTGTIDKVEVIPVAHNDEGTNLICPQNSDTYSGTWSL